MRKNRRISCLRAYSSSFIRSNSGATALEYAVIAAFLSVAIVVSVQNVGLTLHNDFYLRVKDAFAWAIPDKAPARTIAQDRAADPIVTGSVPEK
ncbi:MAG: Flp family type IVb pilin [Pseudomonadota bacterium]